MATLLAIKYPTFVEKLVISNSFSEMPTIAASWVLSIANFIFSLLPYHTIINLMMKFYKEDPYTQRILRESFSIDKKMLLAMGGEGKVMTDVDEGKGSRTIFNHIQNVKIALFKNAFDPLSTMRRDIFNEMIIDFLEDKPLKQYKDVDIFSK